MMDDVLDTPVSTQHRFRYAGFWIRVAAYFLDGLLLSFVNYFIVMLLVAGSVNTTVRITIQVVVTYYITLLALNAFYFAIMESSARQATLGKMAVSIKVGDAGGNRISFLHALGRYFAKLFLAMFTATFSLLWAGWDPKKQSLHDKVAGTCVFYE
jgi:uncharacterized RDD family membrane protein YckC